MLEHITIEQRLEAFAAEGIDSGINLRLWDAKVKLLEKEGIRCLNPKPTGRKGENRYEINFSDPIPGTLSDGLHKMAMQARIKKV